MFTTKSILSAMILALVAAIALVSVGCEESEPAAEADWILEVTANPGNLDLGPGTNGDSTIIAVLFNEVGIPQPGVGVRFSSNAGTLASNGDVVTTDERGESRDVLTTSRESIVTVKSGSVQQQVTVTVGLLFPPVASIVITPGGQARIGEGVQYSGAPSSDSDGTIVQYEWTIISSLPGSSPDTETTTNVAINRSYSQEQDLTVTLRVTDDDALTDETSELYTIVGNVAPTADAQPSSSTGTIQNPSPYFCSATISACSSSDPDGRIVAFEYLWGDGDRSFQLTRSGVCSLQHSYRAPNELGYNVTVIAHDDGDGSAGVCADPANEAELIACNSRKNDTDTAIVICPEPTP